MNSTLLAINAGSSSVKCATFTSEPDPVCLEQERFDGAVATCLPGLLEWLDGRALTTPIAAVGHRLVHGGSEFHAPERLTPDVLTRLRALEPLAPNHLPDALQIVDALTHRWPAVPQIGCFDTAFHAELPDVARRLPIPTAYETRGIRRYGFHGLSYEFLMEELSRVAGPAVAAGRVILAHLGNGSSLAAVRSGRSIDTTMGFTPIGGVVMSTRSGDLDPGVVIGLARLGGQSLDEVERLLTEHAGLVGISGVSGDMRVLLSREATDPACRLAVATFVYAVRKAVGAFTAVLGGLDTLIFSGGIGEHAATIRARICERLDVLGLNLDEAWNAANAPVISAAGARVTVRVIPTNEQLTIARAVYRRLSTR